MKILHINYHQNQGGASVSVNRLIQALIKNKIYSKLLVNKKIKRNNFIIEQFNKSSDQYIHKIKKLMAIYLKKILGAENCYKDSISIFPS